MNAKEFIGYVVKHRLDCEFEGNLDNFVADFDLKDLHIQVLKFHGGIEGDGDYRYAAFIVDGDVDNPLIVQGYWDSYGGENWYTDNIKDAVAKVETIYEPIRD